jgi:hypothetical protein
VRCRLHAYIKGTGYLPNVAPAGGKRVAVLRYWIVLPRKCIDKEGTFGGVCFLISVIRGGDNG